MGKSLVIVESPAKAKTIKKYLGKDFEVLASYGHVRDLLPKEGAVDPDHDFNMKYQVIDRNEKHINAIAKASAKAEALYLATDPDREGEAISWHLYELLKDRKLVDDVPVKRVVFHEITKRAIAKASAKAEALYLATDPDREGEAISWHLYELLKDRKLVDDVPVKRVVFHEITKRAIDDALSHPRHLSMDLINAQQARRALDHLVGFNLSPLLWKKIRQGLSAGRVQSPALRMIVEREEEIERFEPQEYWTIIANARKEQAFGARLLELAGEKQSQFSITDEASARAAEQTLHEAAGGQLTVTRVDKKQRRRNPAPPFTTSTLQQEASRKLGFTTQRTMRIAQQLYEGINVGDGEVGLITYMRTDSVALASDAVSEIRELIQHRYGADNLPDSPRQFKTKAKNAQEAHEAIRPTSAVLTPDKARSFLNDEQFKLYELIWKRTVACQMIHATLNTVAVDLAASPGNTFRATGSTLAHPGFIAVYQEGVDDRGAEDNDDEDRRLPPLEEGDVVALLGIDCHQHFTEAPPRFTEASLVKALEEYGIGRPSTYAPIIGTLLQRGYVELDRRRFTPTDLGRVVNRFLTQHFRNYVDYEFTSRMEDDLDAVSRGERDWKPLMGEFWRPFKELLDDKEENVSRQEAVQVRTLGTDPKSGKPITVRMGRFGPVVQIGSKDDAEKPRFAGLRPHQRMDTISLEEAMDLFKLPRELGETPEGEPVSTSIGRFGPYVRYGNKYVSLKEGDDPYSITLERALELIQERKIADANRVIQLFDNSPIQVLRGRYGPYITDGKKNTRVPKDREPENLTLAECEKLLSEAPEKKPRKRSTRRATTQ